MLTEKGARVTVPSMEKMTIAEVKKYVESRLNIKVGKQQLLFNQGELFAERSLADYGIKNKDVLHLEILT